MKDADNREDITKHGRRATDDPAIKTDIPQQVRSNWYNVFNGLGLAFLLTMAVGTGKFIGQMGTNVGDIDDNKVAIKAILQQNQELIIAIKEQNIQQKESDKRFEEKFDDANEKLEKINDGVQKNRENIIILQNGKMSMRDNTSTIIVLASTR